MDRDKRKYNVRITGLAIDNTNDSTMKKGVENFIFKDLHLDVKMRNITKVGYGTCMYSID